MVKKKKSDPWLQLYKSVTNNFIKPEKHFLFDLHSNTIRIVLHCQMNCAMYFTYNWGSCTEIQLWIWQINCSNINPMRTACQLSANRVKGTNLTMILRLISADVTLGKSLLGAIEHLSMLRDYTFMRFDRTLNAKHHVHLPRASVT